jgi:hypothetical protein
LVSFSLIGTARMEGMVVDEEEGDAAVELILESNGEICNGCHRGGWLYTM